MYFARKVVFLQFENKKTHKKAFSMQRIFSLLLLLLSAVGYGFAQDYPEVTMRMSYIDEDGLLVDDAESYSGGAPFEAHFAVELENAGDYYALYEWRFLKDGQNTPFMTRYEAETDFRFTESGTFYISCIVSLVQGTDTLEYEMETPFIVNIANSKLEVPNAFTPNGDGINDIFQVKEGYESIVKFHAAVFTRSGMRIYEWDDPAGGWDGTMNGNGGIDAPDGAYYFVLTARGADGLKYDRKMVINLLRGYRESTTGAGK